MVDTGIFATTAEIQYKAGASANSTGISEAYTNSFIAQAEAFICLLSKYDYSTNYGSLTSPYKILLKEAASNLAAIYCINYDTSGYYSATESQTMITTLLNRAYACIDLLKDEDRRALIGKT